MQMLKAQVLEIAATNRDALSQILADQKAKNDAAIAAMAKEIGSALAAGENNVSRSVTLDTTPNVVVEYDKFIRQTTLLAPDADGGIPVAEWQVDSFLQDPEKTTVTRNVRMSTD